MKILVSGCSFTHWPEEPGSDKNICWPTYLKQQISNCDITNLAEPGAGNLYIANSIAKALINDPDKYDMILVMWSGITRLDFLTDLTNDDWLALFESYGFYRRVEGFSNRLGYIFSGGQVGPWIQNPATRNLFREMYKISNNVSLAHSNLIEIVKTQELLKQKNIPYKFMSYVNYWNDKSNVSPNGDFGVMGKPELQSLINAIDFSKWIFSDSDKNCIYELAKHNNDYHGDKFHPGITTHQQWVDIMMKHL